MATSQFHSICLTYESIRACRAWLLVSPCRFSRSFLHTRAMPASELSFQGSRCYGLICQSRPSSFACRALSSISPSSRRRKRAPHSQNSREEIRRLEKEIFRLEKERHSVGKPKKGLSDVGGRSLYGGKVGNAGYGSDASTKAKYAKSSPIGRKAKLAASSGSSRSANARALARYEQEDAEEDDDDDWEEDEDDEDAVDEDEEEFGKGFSSNAAMCTETRDGEKSSKDETLSLASSVVRKPNADPTKVLKLSQVRNEGYGKEASTIIDVDSRGGHTIKHPWKEWNDFFDVLCSKNYFKDFSVIDSAIEGERYLRFQSSTHMKHAILEFSRERDDLIRLLTKEHIKTVVAVGCPTTDRKVVNAGKRLRALCEISEDEVCQQCKLKTSCTRAFDVPSANLMAETVDVTRILYACALNASPITEPQVSYPISAVKSACHLLDEFVQLSAHPKDPGLPASKSRLPVKQPVTEKYDMTYNRNVDYNLRPGDWNCPKCDYRNFKRNKNCKECGTLSPDQGNGGGWGSGGSLLPVSAGNGAKHEWKPNLGRKMSDDSNEDLEEDESSPMVSQESEKESKTNAGVSRRKDMGEELPSKSAVKIIKGRGVLDDEVDGKHNDDGVEDALSEDDWSMPKTGSKQGRGFSKRFDDSANDNNDKPPISRAVVKCKPEKGRGFSGKFDDSSSHGDDKFLKGRGLSRDWANSDEEQEGFSDNDDNFGGHISRSASAGGGGTFAIKEGQRDGRLGSSGGGRGSYGKVAFGRHSSDFSRSLGGDDDDGDFKSGHEVGGRRGFRTGGNGRGRGGRRSRGAGGF